MQSFVSYKQKRTRHVKFLKSGLLNLQSMTHVTYAIMLLKLSAVYSPPALLQNEVVAGLVKSVIYASCFV